MDDLVAELTLRIRNDVNAGIDEIRGEFSGLGETLANLNSTLTSLDEALRGLQAPLELKDGLADAAASAKDATTAIDGIGTSLDADIAKVKDLGDGLSQLPGAMPGGIVSVETSGGGNGSGGGGDEESAGGGGDKNERGAGSHGDTVVGGGLGLLGDAFMGQIAYSTADEWARKYAEFSETAAQVTITEGLQGNAASTERSRIETLADQTALRYAASSQDLINAYEYLVTDRVPKSQIEAILPSLAEASTAYNVPAYAISNAAFAELRMLDIAPSDVGNSLAVLHHAAMQGHFGIADFGRYLGNIAAQGRVMGISGAHGNVVLASALEAIQESTNDSGDTDTELKNLLEYLRSPIASRSFDPTGRTLTMMGPAGRRLREEYHLPNVDLTQYLDAELKHGVDPINAMLDFFDKYTANVKSPIDLGNIFGMYFHNQTAAQAFLGLYQNQDIFRRMQSSLSGVSDTTLRTDYDTARAAPQASVNLLDEEFAQLQRELGQNVIPSLIQLGHAANLALEGLNWIGNTYSNDFSKPVGSFIGSAAAHVAHFFQGPYNFDGAPLRGAPNQRPTHIDLHVHVDKDGNATAHASPGTTTRVDQGNVLTGVH